MIDVETVWRRLNKVEDHLHALQRKMSRTDR